MEEEEVCGLTGYYICNSFPSNLTVSLRSADGGGCPPPPNPTISLGSTGWKGRKSNSRQMKTLQRRACKLTTTLAAKSTGGGLYIPVHKEIVVGECREVVSSYIARHIIGDSISQLPVRAALAPCCLFVP